MELLSSQHFDAKKEEKLLNRFESFSLLISELHKQIVRISAEEMKKYGLQSPSAHMLLVLYKNGACTAANLSRKIGKNKAEISRTIVELEKKGFIEKENSKTNYRVRLKLTESGNSTAVAIEKAAISCVCQASSGISDSERETMYRVLDLICKNLQTITNDKNNAKMPDRTA